MEINNTQQQEYQIKYQELIQEALIKNRGLKREKGFEIHHIIPRALGGDDSKENLVKLTCFEHILAHYYKAIESSNTKMIYGFSRMIDQKWSKLSELEHLSIEQLEYYAQLRAEGHKFGGHFQPVSEETKKKQSLAKQKFLAENPGWTNPTSWTKGHKTWNKGLSYGEETRKKIREARAKQDMSWRHSWHPSEEARQKMSDSHKGKKQSLETKQKLTQIVTDLAKARYQRYLEKKNSREFLGTWNEYQKYEKTLKGEKNV